MFVPNEPAEVLEVARLRLARLNAPPEELLAASKSVEPCELKLLICGLRLPAVPGGEWTNDRGQSDQTSVNGKKMAIGAA